VRHHPRTLCSRPADHRPQRRLHSHPRHARTPSLSPPPSTTTRPRPRDQHSCVHCRCHNGRVYTESDLQVQRATRTCSPHVTSIRQNSRDHTLIDTSPQLISFALAKPHVPSRPPTTQPRYQRSIAQALKHSQSVSTQSRAHSRSSAHSRCQHSSAHSPCQHSSAHSRCQHSSTHSRCQHSSAHSRCQHSRAHSRCQRSSVHSRCRHCWMRLLPNARSAVFERDTNVHSLTNTNDDALGEISLDVHFTLTAQAR